MEPIGTIKNTGVRNTFGGGYEQKITMNNGDEYIIRNSPLSNNVGGGQRQEIIKVTSSSSSESSSIDYNSIHILTDEERAYFNGPEYGRKLTFHFIGIILAIVAFMALLLGIIPLISWLI